MVAGLSAHSWLCLVVYFVVMGLVVRGVQIPLSLALSSLILRAATWARLIDPAAPPSPPPPLSPPSSAVPASSKLSSPVSATPSTAQSQSSLLTTPPVEHKRLYIPLDLRTAPVAGCIFLLATTTIDGSVVRAGIVGEHGVRPYDVLVLFIALAYISTALDSTGGLRALAFYISQKSARAPPHSPPSADKTASGLTLFTILYAFWFIFGVLVGNDPIVLSGTAFLGYFTRATGITAPRAFTMSQFIAANVASAALVTSNPTNVLITGAWELNFLTGFTAYTLLPAVITALVAYPVLLGLFTFFRPHTRLSTGPTSNGQRYIPKQLLPPDIDPRSALIDPTGAIFHASLLLITLAVLVGTSFVKGGKVEVWMVTAPAGIIAFLRDIWSERKPPSPAVEEHELQAPTGPVDRPTLPSARRISLPYFVNKLCKRFPTTTTTVSRLPLALLTFAGGIFVLARALTARGWTDIFAGWLVKICINPAATVFFVGYFTAFVLCPICGTNIGGTILAVEIIRSSTFSSSPRVVENPLILKGAIYSLALASNVGALSWTISSSLAGLLWVRILGEKGIKVTQAEFARWIVPVLLVLSTVSSAVVLLELYYW
ncbi:hypothetical protein JCM8547_009260 [Rhodosporidiobolus lusitaniae]